LMAKTREFYFFQNPPAPLAKCICKRWLKSLT
jgi:hypothetical protein